MQWLLQANPLAQSLEALFSPTFLPIKKPLHNVN